MQAPVQLLVGVRFAVEQLLRFQEDAVAGEVGATVHSISVAPVLGHVNRVQALAAQRLDIGGWRWPTTAAARAQTQAQVAPHGGGLGDPPLWHHVEHVIDRNLVMPPQQIIEACNGARRTAINLLNMYVVLHHAPHDCHREEDVHSRAGQRDDANPYFSSQVAEPICAFRIAFACCFCFCFCFCCTTLRLATLVSPVVFLACAWRWFRAVALTSPGDENAKTDKDEQQ